MRDINYEKLTKRAIAIFTRERIALVDNDIEALRDCSVLKAKLLDELDKIEKLIASQPDIINSDQCRNQLASVQSIIARRASENGQLQRANQPMTEMLWPK